MQNAKCKTPEAVFHHFMPKNTSNQKVRRIDERNHRNDSGRVGDKRNS
jgi:hypothetical protein